MLVNYNNKCKTGLSNDVLFYYLMEETEVAMNKKTVIRTRNIRINSELHEKLKTICRQEGRLLGAFVNSLLEEGYANGTFNALLKEKGLLPKDQNE